MVTAVGQVRREQRVKAIVGESSLQRFKTDLLQQHVAVGIGEYFFADPVAAAEIGVDQFKGGDAGLKWLILKRTVALLLGKERPAIGDDEAEIAGASLIDAREIHFI